MPWKDVLRLTSLFAILSFSVVLWYPFLTTIWDCGFRSWCGRGDDDSTAFSCVPTGLGLLDDVVLNNLELRLDVLQASGAVVFLQSHNFA
jgi:hypothetical protein